MLSYPVMPEWNHKPLLLPQSSCGCCQGNGQAALSHHRRDHSYALPCFTPTASGQVKVDEFCWVTFNQSAFTFRSELLRFPPPLIHEHPRRSPDSVMWPLFLLPGRLWAQRSFIVLSVLFKYHFLKEICPGQPSTVLARPSSYTLLFISISTYLHIIHMHTYNYVYFVQLYSQWQ